MLGFMWRSLMEQVLYRPTTFPAAMRFAYSGVLQLTEASSDYRIGNSMLVRIREVFEILEYFVVRLMLFVLAIIDAISLIVHAIHTSF